MFAVIYSTSPPLSESVSTSENMQNTMQTVLDNENIQFQLYGNKCRFRSGGSERAGGKFKHKETIEL